MALNATFNARLESPEELLNNLLSSTHLLLDICAHRQSVFYFKSGFNFLHLTVKKILKHGAKIGHFLIYSQSSYAVFDDWLEKTLLEQRLISKLTSKLFKAKLPDCYFEWAFLRNENLFQLLIVIIESLAVRDFKKINNIQISSKLETGATRKMNDKKRVVPDSDLLSVKGGQTKISQTQALPISVSHYNFSTDNRELKPKIECSLLDHAQIPSIDEDKKDENNSNLNENQSISRFSYSFGSQSVVVTDFSHLEEETPRLDPMIACFKSTDIDSREIRKSSISPQPVAQVPKSFLESGGKFLQPISNGNFRLPQKGQKLKEFLESLSDASQPELDRENSHFNISEAMISAFERMKMNQKVEELQKQRDLERVTAMFGETKGINSCHINGECSKSSTGLVGAKKKIPTRHRANIPFTETEESEYEFWKQDRHPPYQIKKKPKGFKYGSEGLGSTTASNTSDSESQFALSSKEDLTSSTTSNSAENVALSLLRNVKMEKVDMTDASALQWLVSERDCPQQSLLPLPKNWNSASDSDTESLDKSIRLRGTAEWAPPRPQIIFTIHSPPHLHSLMELQKFRCAGCGVKVQKKYANTFRYCNYLGRYFCSGCHSKKASRLPQMILHRWDFNYYQISNFSASLLESLRFDPVYNVQAINPILCKKGRIASFRTFRIQLKYLGEYLKNCKSASDLYEDLNSLPSYYIAEPDLYSLDDFIQLRTGSGRPLKVKEIVTKGIQHVLHCVLCKQLGFLCEICRSKEVIFPFQINRVRCCLNCSNCFHLKCYNPSVQECPKCLRLFSRKQSIINLPEFPHIELPIA